MVKKLGWLQAHRLSQLEPVVKRNDEGHCREKGQTGSAPGRQPSRCRRRGSKGTAARAEEELSRFPPDVR